MKRTIIIIIALLVAGATFAQNLNEIQYGGYLKASKSLWERAISVAEKQHGEQSFEKAMAVYGLLNATMATQDEETFDAYVDTASDLLKSIIEQKPEWGEPKAVLSSIYGLRMAYDPWKGMIYGGKSNSFMADAYNAQPESPLVQKLYAGSKLYTPSMFGGDVDVAKKSFMKAIEIYENGNDTDHWLYLNALVGLSMAYNKLDEPIKAKEILEKAIKIEPEFYWAKSILAGMNQ